MRKFLLKIPTIGGIIVLVRGRPSAAPELIFEIFAWFYPAMLVIKNKVLEP